MKQILPWLVVAAVTLFAGLTCHRLETVARNYVVADANRRAALDTTRVHLVGENQGLSRLVEQASIDVDELGVALGRSEDANAALARAIEDREVEHVAAVQALELAFDSVSRENAVLNADILTRSRSGDAFRVVAIDIEGPPISGDVDVSIPADTTRPAEVEFVRLVVEPFELTYALGCAGPDAVVAVGAPAWISLLLRPGRVDPDVCNPPPRRRPFVDIFRLSPSNVVWGVAGAVLGWVALSAVQQ